MELYCYLKDGWIVLDPDSGHTNIMRKLSRHLRVAEYDRKLRKVKTSIYEFPRLYQFCVDKGVVLNVTDKLYRNFIRYKYKRQLLKKKKKSTKVELELWTDDPQLQLLKYQARAVNVAYVMRRFAIGDDMGVGKTPTAIAIMLKAFEYYGHQTALIACPARIIHQWKQEILKFTKLKPKDISIVNEVKVICKTGEMEKYDGRVKICKDCKHYKKCTKLKKNPKKLRKQAIEDSKIMLCTYDMLRICRDYISDKQYDVIICDEATALKNYRAGVTKAAKKILKNQEIGSLFIPMSGTFIENRLDELYSIIALIDERIFGKYHSFKDRYLTVDYWGKVIDYRNLDEFKKKANEVLIRRTIDEVWKERPSIVETVRECEMTKFQAGVYEKARERVLDDIIEAEKAKKINQAMLATLIGYLLQVADTVKSIDPECTKSAHSSKLTVLKEIIKEEIPKGEKLVIFSRFANKVIPYLVEYLESLKCGSVGVITGSTGKGYKKVLKRFKKQSKMRFLVCSDSMAYGANLQNARYVINFDMPWNPAKVEQRIRRVYRKGQEKCVTVINLLVPGTVEEYLYEMLAAKKELAGKLLKQSKVRKSNKVDLRELAKKI